MKIHLRFERWPDLSSYLWLTPTAKYNSEFATTTLARLIRTYTAMTTWGSDQRSHFKNEIMESLSRDYQMSRNFTVAYSPWIKGTVEAVNCNIMAACQALTTEEKLGPHEWRSLLPILEAIINTAPNPRLGKRLFGVHCWPLEVMIGIEPRRNLLRNELTFAGKSKVISLECIRVR